MTLTAIEQLDVSFAIPGDADGLHELLFDSSKMVEVRDKHGDEGIVLINAAYQEAFAKADGGKAKAEEDEQFALGVESAVHDMARANGLAIDGKLNVTPDIINAHLDAVSKQRGPHYNANAPGHAVADVYANTGEALLAPFVHDQPQKAMGREDFAELRSKAMRVQQIQAAYSSHIGSSGGFLMPEAFRNQLLQLAHEEAIVRSRATTIPMTTPKITLPAIHETSRASNLFGGVTVYWTAEEASSTESEAAFKTVSLEPDTMTGYAEIPNETMTDTIAFGAYFDATFPRAFAFEEDYAFLQGSGVDRPLGALQSPARIQVAKEPGQDADTIVYENLLEMWMRLPASSMGRAVWIANQDAMRELGTMSLSVGTGGSPVWVVSAHDGLPMTLFGRPVLFSEKVNTVGDEGDLLLADFSFYLIGDLQTVTVTSSEHYKFKERMTAFSIVERVDGKPWISESVTPRHGANNLSPFVTLAERA